MGRILRYAGIGGFLVLAAAAIFLIPTVWFKPWFIEHFYARVFIQYALAHPMLLSQLRILEPYGLDFHSDDLDDFSVEFTLETADQIDRNLRILRSYDRRSQSPDQRLSTDVLEWFLRTQAEGRPFLFHSYPLNQLDGIQSALPDFMLNTHQVRSVDDARDYVARLSRFGVALDQAIESIRYRAERGIVPPRFVVRAVAREVEEFIGVSEGRNVLYTEFEKKLELLEEIPESARVELLDSARRKLEEIVYPAYRRVGTDLGKLEAMATDEDGVWKLPDGKAYYDWALRWHTTSELNADAIHAIGLAEVARIHREMRRILETEGYPTADLGATLQALNREQRFLYPDSEEGRAQILADYETIIDEVQAWLPEYFGQLPRAPVAVERVPEFKERGSPGAYYQLPAVDGSRPGVFFANLRSVEEVPRFGMRTLTFHEAIPGHHLQVALALELEGVPFFRRVIPFTAFIEGWALYAERLAAEEGLHPTPYDHLGQLIAEVFRAVRLVVDTGIHAKRWTREQAINYMLRNTGMPEGDVVSEVERYIVNPGQACAYKLGQLEILELRDRARKALGERFDYREFHNVILGNGGLPLTLLERVVDDWLTRKLSAELYSAHPFSRNAS
jgi:uncharacterized protein (DUF885 family)